MLTMVTVKESMAEDWHFWKKQLVPGMTCATTDQRTSNNFSLWKIMGKPKSWNRVVQKYLVLVPAVFHFVQLKFVWEKLNFHINEVRKWPTVIARQSWLWTFFWCIEIFRFWLRLHVVPTVFDKSFGRHYGGFSSWISNKVDILINSSPPLPLLSYPHSLLSSPPLFPSLLSFAAILLFLLSSPLLPLYSQGAGEGEREVGETGEEDHHRHQEDGQNWTDGTSD